jgi:hypothetical protein
LYDAIRFDPKVSSQIGHIHFFIATTLDGKDLPANHSHRDLVNQTQREISERNTILRLYWISLNLERYSTILPIITPDSSLILFRDITDCFDEFPKTSLSDLQDILALPLGCEESTTTHMPMTTRTIYTFFLAETGLSKDSANEPNT